MKRQDVIFGSFFMTGPVTSGPVTSHIPTLPTRAYSLTNGARISHREGLMPHIPLRSQSCLLQLECLDPSRGFWHSKQQKPRV